jgi:Tfp pilus assembly protein PilO
MAIKKEIYIIILASFLLSVSLLLFFICPLLEEIGRDSRQIIEQKNKILILKNEFDEAQKFQKKYETLKPDLDKLDQIFVDSKNPVSFIEFIEKTGSDSGVRTEINAPSFAQDGALNYAEIHLSCKGDFSGILKFINSLETDDYLIQVENLNISNFKEAQSSKKIITETQAELAIKVFSK